MGNRVHVVKKQRKYGDTEAFNWNYQEFKDLLSNLGCNVCEQDEEGCSSEFEMTCDDYKRAMEILKRIIAALKKNKDVDLNTLDFSDLASSDDDPDWCSFDPDNYDWNDVKDSVDKLEGYSIDEILKIMRSFWSERDKKSDWIQFSAW
jgi:hypothetical protein